ncbi:MAG: DUF4033 domain-containing protein [Nodosilinea sp.]
MLSAAGSDSGSGPASAPATYHDSRMDRLLIALFSRKMARALGQGTDLSGYDGLVDLSKKMMQGRTAQEQQVVVATVLKSLVPAPVLWLIRTVFSPTPLVCTLNAWFAAMLFEWLVGPCEVTSAEVPAPDGRVRRQASGVHIKKCRYLDESRCVGLCVNLCKLPTQRFFTEEFGIPLTMTPNFDDFSCEMVFGQVPPPLTTEEAYRQPCLASDCSPIKAGLAPCPRVRQS